MKIIIDYKTGEIEVNKVRLQNAINKECELIELKKYNLNDERALKAIDNKIAINRLTINYCNNKLNELENI